MFNSDFYPTPKPTIIDMVGTYLRSDGNWKKRILEPSAGKGDILDMLTGFYRVPKDQVYAIEIDPELRATLQGKGYQVIDSDFLKFCDPLLFDLIVMNPPFSAGAAHLLKAWDVVRDGGDVVCLLNAETLRNPHSAERKLLKTIIDEHGEVRFIGSPFKDAQRKTEVEIALVRLHKPERKAGFTQFDELSPDMEAPEREAQFSASPLASADMVAALVAQYERAREILRQMNALRSEYRFYAGAANTGDFDKDDNDKLPHLNDQIGTLKARFWKYVFDKTKIGQLTTSEFQRKFYEMRDQQSQMAFTVDNVMAVLDLFMLSRHDILLECIESVFDEGTKFHEKNRVYVEGWKTNKIWRLNKTIIMPYSVEFTKWGSWSLSWRRREFWRDLDKVCCYLSGKRVEMVKSLTDTLEERMNALRSTDDYSAPFESEFFSVKIFKKGTIHLTFRDLDLLARFNQAAAKRKGWVLGDGS